MRSWDLVMAWPMVVITGWLVLGRDQNKHSARAASGECDGDPGQSILGNYRGQSSPRRCGFHSFLTDDCRASDRETTKISGRHLPPFSMAFATDAAPTLWFAPQVSMWRRQPLAEHEQCRCWNNVSIQRWPDQNTTLHLDDRADDPSIIRVPGHL